MATDAVTVREAARALAGMEGFEEGLRRRTEGLTWMIWGLVFAGITASYYAGDLAQRMSADPDGPRPWTLVFPWSPWALAGGLATVALWRSAALHAPGLRRPWWLNALALVLVPAGMWALFIASWFLPPALQPAFTPPALVGLAALAVIASPLLRLTPQGRRVGLAAAGAQALAGVAVGFASLDVHASYIAYATILGTAWLAAGLWQTTRG